MVEFPFPAEFLHGHAQEIYIVQKTSRCGVGERALKKSSIQQQKRGSVRRKHGGILPCPTATNVSHLLESSAVQIAAQTIKAGDSLW